MIQGWFEDAQPTIMARVLIPRSWSTPTPHSWSTPVPTPPESSRPHRLCRPALRATRKPLRHHRRNRQLKALHRTRDHRHCQRRRRLRLPLRRRHLDSDAPRCPRRLALHTWSGHPQRPADDPRPHGRHPYLPCTQSRPHHHTVRPLTNPVPTPDIRRALAHRDAHTGQVAVAAPTPRRLHRDECAGRH